MTIEEAHLLAKLSSYWVRKYIMGSKGTHRCLRFIQVLDKLELL